MRASLHQRFLRPLRYFFAACIWFLCWGNLSAEPMKVVYHVADGLEQASHALVNIRNHLQAAPDTKIVVVALGAGVDFLLEGAIMPGIAKPFDARVAFLAAQGVEFRVCNNSLKGRDISPARLLLETKTIPSGVAEIARLQAKEGYVYIRP
jgi:uncharacterized protein